MKRILLLFSCLLIISGIAVAQKKTYEFARDKQVSKTYPLSSGDKISLSNQFGDVVVKTWAKNEIKVDVSIKVSSDVKDVADNTFERIDIENGKQGNEVTFRTVLKKEEKNGYKGSYSNNIEINYTVMMPEGQDLNIANKFGKMILPDLTGKVNIKEEFGGLVTGKLTNPQDIDVRFSTVEIASLQNGNLDLQFIKNGAVIKNATGKLAINARFCKDNGIIIPASNLQALDVRAEHSLVYLVSPKDASIDATVNTHFGSFKNKTDLKFQSKDEVKDSYAPRFDFTYYYNSSSPKTQVHLKGNFTDFIITNELPDMKDYSKKTVSL